MTEALEQLSKAAQKYGIDIPVNCTSLEDLTAQLQAMGLQINVTQDAVTGMLNGIAVSGRNINGQFVQLNQTIAQIGNTAKSVDVFASISGQGNEGNEVLTLYKSILDYTNKRGEAETQLANAIRTQNTDEISKWSQKLSYYADQETLDRERLEVIQQQNSMMGSQVDLFAELDRKATEIESKTSSERQLINSSSSQDLIEFSNNLKSSIDTIKQFESVSDKLASSGQNDTMFDLYNEKVNALKPSLEAVKTSMESVGVVFTQQGAVYTGLDENIQKCVDAWNKMETAIDANQQKAMSSTAIKTQAQDIQTLSQQLSKYYEYQKKLENAQTDAQRNVWTQALAEQAQKYGDIIAQVQQYEQELRSTGSTGTQVYSANVQAVEKLVQKQKELAISLEAVKTANTDAAADAATIEQTVTAYKAYRDQLDRIYALKKENATGVDIKAEQSKLEQLEKAYKKLEETLLSNGEAVKKNTEYNRDKNQVTRESIQNQKALNVTMQDNSLADLVAQTIEYAVSLESLQQVLSSVKDEVLELDEAMTNIRLVTGDTAENTRELMSTYSDIAKELGTTTSEVAESADSWLRQGYSIEQTNDLIEAAQSLQVIGDMSAEDASTSLISVLNGYKVAAEDAMQIVDKLTTLDINLASGSSDIAVAMSKTAASAADAGVELDKMLAIVAVTQDRTQQAAETIGRAWNSILQRMNKISAGKDVSDTGAALNDVDKTLSKVGISLRDENGILRESGEVLDEIAAKWKTLDKNQQSQVATA